MAFDEGSAAIKGLFNNEGDIKLSHEEVWSAALLLFKQRLEERSFNTWFRPIVPVSCVGSTLTIRVPSNFFIEYIEKNYSYLFAEVLTRLLGSGARLKYIAPIDSSTPLAGAGSMTTLSRSDAGGNLNVELAPTQNTIGWKHNLIENFTFDTFIESDSNKVSRTLACHISEKPGMNTYNPFFVYGAPGVGKTHLINAIGWEIVRKRPEMKVLYISSDTFLQQFTSASCNRKTDDFTRFYRQVDVLLIDDIQGLIGKEKTQVAFFQIFNHLFQLGKQIVLSCDKPPVDLQGLHERLASRISGSCTTQIDRPDEELRRNVLHQKMEQESVKLSEDVVNYIVKSVTGNLRTLEGTISTLLAHSVARGVREIDLKFAHEIISLNVRIDEPELTLERFMELVSKQLDITPEEMRSKSRKQEIVMARQIVMYLTHKYTDEPLTAIGEMLGGRTHATVLHSCNVVEDQVENNRLMKSTIEEVEKACML